MKNFNLRKYLAENKLLKEDNDGVEVMNYLRSLPDQYDMSNSQYDLWEDIMESINIHQYIGNYIKSLPVQYDFSESQYDLWDDIMTELNIPR